MSVGRDEVLRIASLARLRLGEADLERMTDDLNSILGHVDELAALEDSEPRSTGLLEGAPSTRPHEHTVPGEQPLDPTPIAPDFRDGFFVVPPPPGVHAREEEG